MDRKDVGENGRRAVCAYACTEQICACQRAVQYLPASYVLTDHVVLFSPLLFPLFSFPPSSSPVVSSPVVSQDMIRRKFKVGGCLRQKILPV